MRSPTEADLVVAVLNADRSVMQHGEQRPVEPRVVRYSAVPARRGKIMIVGDDRGRDTGRLRPGIVAATSDRELAEHVASRLNEIDPAVFKHPHGRTGIGWW